MLSLFDPSAHERSVAVITLELCLFGCAAQVLLGLWRHMCRSSVFFATGKFAAKETPQDGLDDETQAFSV